MWIVVVVMVEVSSVDCGENRSAEKGKESEMRKGAEYRVGKEKVCVGTSSAMVGTEADEGMLQESLSARVCTAHVRNAMEGYPTMP